jgi:hypothetical protein
VGQTQPGRALIVEVSQRAFLKFCLAQAGRIQPSIALFDQIFGGLGNSLDAWIIFRFMTGRPGEGESLKGV